MSETEQQWQFRNLLDQERPLYMPPGSIRSLIALGITAGYLAGVVEDLQIVTLVLGFYYGSRGGEEA